MLWEISALGRSKCNLDLGDKERGKGCLVVGRSCDCSKFNVSKTMCIPFLPYHLYCGAEKKNVDCTCPWEIVPAHRRGTDNRGKPVRNFVESSPHSKVFNLSLPPPGRSICFYF